MKLYLNDEHYITDVGTNLNNKKCVLNYLWIGSENEFIGTISDSELIKLKKAIDRIVINKKKKTKK